MLSRHGFSIPALFFTEDKLWYKLSQNEMGKIKNLFAHSQETLVWSCLQGLMGTAYANHAQKPTRAQIIIGSFSFFAGEADRRLVANLPETLPSGYMLMIPENEAWSALIEEQYGGKAERFLRYAIKKEPGVFDRQKLQAYIKALPPEYTLAAIDKALYEQTGKEEWSKYFTFQFPTYEDYRTRGIGYVALYQGKPVSGASSYAIYDGGIEIEVDTQENHRRKGLALACCAKLILACLERGLYPSWDAHNLRSVALAEKLGYHRGSEYVAYNVILEGEKHDIRFGKMG